MKTWYLLLLGFLLAVASCRKVGPEFEPSCEALPEDPGSGWNEVLVGDYVTKPCFNPENSDEIVFVYRGAGTTADQMLKYNLATKEHHVLYEGTLLRTPAWGRNGWILLNFPDQNIYKIKDNGDSLMQLTMTGGKFYPMWNLAGDKFACENIGLAQAIIYDSEGVPLDSLFHGTVGLSWNHSRYSPKPFDDYVHLTDMVADTVIDLVPAPPTKPVWGQGAIFTSEERLVVSYASGIYAIDVPTRKVELLRESCDAVLYIQPSYSPQRNQILWAKISRRPDGGWLYSRTELVLTDVNGGNEEVVGLEL